MESIQQAREYTDDVEFSPEDASRTELEFLEEITQAAVEAGATTINLPDTVGYATPQTYGEIFAHLLRKLPILQADAASSSPPIATTTWAWPSPTRWRPSRTAPGRSNARSTASASARQRRAGRNRHGAAHAATTSSSADTRIDATKIYPASRMVSTLTGLAVQRNKAIVGENAFAHEAGIHQDGVLKYRETYEIMDPATVGIPKSSLVLGKHSGRHAFKDRVSQLGYTLNDEQLEAAFTKFKTLADKKKEVFDEDIEALIDDQLELTTGLWELRRPAGDGRLQHHPHRHGHAARQQRTDSSGRSASATARSTRSTPRSSASPASRPRSPTTASAPSPAARKRRAKCRSSSNTAAARFAAAASAPTSSKPAPWPTSAPSTACAARPTASAW